MFGSSSRSSSWKFWLGWALANTIGLFLSWIALGLVASVALLPPEESSSVDILTIIILLVLLLLPGGVLGFFQSSVLTIIKNRVPNISWWMPVTSGSLAISLIAASFSILPLGFPDWLGYILASGIVGLIVGLAQFLLIRQQIPQSGYWILGSIFGWIGYSLSIVGGINMASFSQPLLSSIGAGAIGGVAYGVIIICGMVYGAITGQVWRRLIRNLKNTS